MSFRPRKDAVGSRLHRVLALGLRNPKPTGSPLEELPDEMLALIAAALVDMDDAMCTNTHALCNKLRQTSRGFDLCSMPGFWRAAFRMLLNLPTTERNDPTDLAPLPPHEARNWQIYLHTVQQPTPLVGDKWKAAFEDECRMVHTNASVAEAVNWCTSHADWNHHVYGPVEQWRVQRVTDMHNLFADVASSNLDLSEWDTSRVKNYEYMFSGTSPQGVNSSTASVGLERWNVSNARTMKGMFTSDTLGETTDFNRDVSRWRPRRCLNFEAMFWQCIDFSCDIGGWDVSSATNMQEMFSECDSFRVNLGQWDVRRVANFRSMFETTNTASGYGLAEPNLKLWVTTSAVDMASMFNGCATFNEDLSGWDVSKVTDTHRMFNDCAAFECDLSRWDVSRVANMNHMFANCARFQSSLRHWKTGACEDMSFMFAMRRVGQTQDAIGQQMHMPHQGYRQVNSLRWWDVSQVEAMSGMFSYCTEFRDDISHWNTVSLRRANYMFKGCSAFNANISHWNVGRLAVFNDMFFLATSFRQNLSHWNLQRWIVGQRNIMPSLLHDRLEWWHQHVRNSMLLNPLQIPPEFLPSMPEHRADLPPLPPLPPLPFLPPLAPLLP